MSVMLKRWNWTTEVYERIPVNETVLQEMVDALFARNEAWSLDLDQFRRRIRSWQARLETVEPERPQVIATIAPQTTTVAPEPNNVATWPVFLSMQRKAGRTPAEAAVEWKARRA